MVGADVEENPHGTRVFKTRVSPFYFFLLLPCVRFHLLLRSSFFVLQHCKSRDQIFQSPTQRSSSVRLTQISSPHVQLTKSSLRSSSVLRSSKRLFGSDLPLFFLCSSSDRSCSILLQNRVLETQFCFLELKFMRLEIYVASFCQLTKWKSSL